MTQARVRVYDRISGTLRGTLSGVGLSFKHGKGVDASDIAFTAPLLESAMAADPDMLDDAIVLVQADFGSGYVSLGTPYIVNPTAGSVIGQDEGAAVEQDAFGKGILMMTAGWPILHQGGVVNRRGPESRYFGWMSPTFDASSWSTPTHYTRSPAPTTAKKGQPAGWPDAAADWLGISGGLKLFRSPSFTVTTARKYRIVSSADEEHKVYLMGPGWGGVIIDASAQETGYTQLNVFDEILQPGTYFCAVEVRGVTSAGGDGLDAMCLSVGTVGTNGKFVLPAVMNSGASGWKALGQSASASRPGLPVGELVSILRSETSTYGVPVSHLVPSFTSTVDTAGAAWGTDTERSWPVGTPVSSALADLSLVADFDARGNNNFDAYVTQGSDKSATVKLRKGTAVKAANENVSSYTWDADPITATRAVFKTQAGYGSRIYAGAETAHEPRAVYVESSQSVGDNSGNLVADAAISAGYKVTRRYIAQITAVTGCLPWVDFGIGDTIAGYDHTGARKNLQVVSISANRDGDMVNTFTVELSE